MLAVLLPHTNFQCFLTKFPAYSFLLWSFILSGNAIDELIASDSKLIPLLKIDDYSQETHADTVPYNKI